MSWLKLDREMAADIYQMARNNYTKNGMVDEPTLNTLVTSMLAEAGIKNVTVSQLVDFSLLQQALKVNMFRKFCKAKRLRSVGAFLDVFLAGLFSRRCGFGPKRSHQRRVSQVYPGDAQASARVLGQWPLP